MKIPYPEEQLRFLFKLRRSGRTNMYAAVNYLEDAFGLDREQAKAVLRYWMDHFVTLGKELGED